MACICGIDSNKVLRQGIKCLSVNQLTTLQEENMAKLTVTTDQSVTTFSIRSFNRAKQSSQVSWLLSELNVLSMELALISGRESHEMYATIRAHARVSFC